MTTASVLNAVLNLINTEGPPLAGLAVSGNARALAVQPADMPAVVVEERSDRFPDRLVTFAQRLHGWRLDVHAWKAYSDNPPTPDDENDWQMFEGQLVNVFAQEPLLNSTANTNTTWLSEEQNGDTWTISRSQYWNAGAGVTVRHLVLSYNVSERYPRQVNGYLG